MKIQRFSGMVVVIRWIFERIFEDALLMLGSGFFVVQF